MAAEAMTWNCGVCTFENEDGKSKCAMCDTVRAAAKGNTGKESELIGRLRVDGIEIQVRFGDLTVEKVDAICNAANTMLDHASGLAGAIVRTGGRSIQDESDELIRKNGRLNDGECVVTGAGSLPCKKIFHVTGPIWRTGSEGEPLLLQMAVRAGLEEAHRRGFSSVAMPAVSSGIFGFPKPLCATIMFDTAREFAEEHSGNTSLKEIRFTNFDQATVDVFVAELEKRI